MLFNTSIQTLKILALLVWYFGVVVLILKSAYLFINISTLGVSTSIIILLIIVGFILGLLKAKYLFVKFCDKNIRRIEGLKNPKIWQFYRARFFLFLVSMITLGSYLSKQFQTEYLHISILATVELSIATALLFSGNRFWKNN